jgi:hydroxylamine reductase
MFCFQCEQTAKGEGCTKVGVCGKSHEVATLQDLLIYSLKGFPSMRWRGEKSAWWIPKSTDLPVRRVFQL